ncbi:MAG: hypothetical protein KBT01_04845, partial [Clostridiales bacterium]|nr:hypothetical protein [Candidatus Blautia equi]
MKIYANQPEDQNRPSVKSENPNAFSDKLTKPTEKEKLKDLHGKKKLDYIWDYYKTHIIITLLVIAAVGYTVYEKMHTKTPLISVTCANVTPSDELAEQLTTGFVKDYLQLDEKKYEIPIDTNLLVGEAAQTMDPQYAYTSQMKLMAYLSASEMHIMLMNQGALEEMALNSYLEELPEVFASVDPELYDLVKDYIVEANMIVEDNQEEVLKDRSIPYEAVFEAHPFALRLTGTPLFPEGSFDQDIYLGIAVNADNLPCNTQYIR